MALIHRVDEKSKDTKALSSKEAPSNLEAVGPGEMLTSEKLELCVGNEVFLEVHFDELNRTRYRTYIRGWEEGKLIILEQPGSAGAALPRKAYPCAVRFFNQGEIWAFYTTILNTASRRVEGLVQVKWPSKVARVQVRRHERVDLNISCSVSLPAGGLMKGSLADLSAGGCSLSLNLQLSKGEQIKLSFSLPEGIMIDKHPAIVRNVADCKQDGYRYGCQFTDTETKDPYGIDYYVARKIAQERGELPPHPLIIVVSRNAEDAVNLQDALGPAGYEVVLAPGVFDLGYHMRASNPTALMLDAGGCDMPPLDVYKLVKKSSGAAALKVALYGGNDALHVQARSAGIALCLPDLAQPEKIKGLLE